MNELLNVVTPLHVRTKRDYLARMCDDKVACMQVAKRYDRHYWDGARSFGYGGYHYDGRWAVVAEALVAHFKLTNESSVLDVGCGKGYLLYELTQLLPGIQVTGFDFSDYAIAEAKPEIQSQLFIHDAANKFPFQAGQFDCVLSLGTLHNLPLPKLVRALQEIERVGRTAYVMTESYRNESELFNLQCWALTCESFFEPEEWRWVFSQSGYTGDYELIYFE